MRKRVMILGQEGYIGTALTLHLRKKGYLVRGIDNGMRERNVASIKSESLTQKTKIGAMQMSVTSPQIEALFREFQPDAIIHLAEQPSAPFSMRSTKDACDTQQNNVVGTLNVLHAIKKACPHAHLIKLGTEGEYPDWLWNGKHIPEGSRMDVIDASDRDGEPWTIPTPRYAGSWYHFSKLHDSMNIDYACRIWGLRATDVNQGVVYGHVDGTRLDYDEYFGTVVNRFVVQAAADMPLTVYGTGEQTRGFIALQNSIDAIQLLIDNPADKGEFRVIHQTTEAKTVMEIAEMVQKVSGCQIKTMESPRAEMPSNSFTFDTTTLEELGLEPVDMELVIRDLYQKARANRSKIKRNVIKPTTKWN